MKPVEFIRSDGISLLRIDGFFLDLFGSLELRALRKPLWRSPLCQKLWPLPQPCACPSWKRLPAPAQPSHDCFCEVKQENISNVFNMGPHSDSSLLGNPDPEPPSQAAPRFLTLRNLVR